MKDEFEELSERIASLGSERYAREATLEEEEETLERSELRDDPLRQFAAWLSDALEAHPAWPNAVTLATADAGGIPSARTVLLKGVDVDGFTFFTNYASRKATELAANPRAALVFYWPALARQVCVRGSVTKVSRSESEAYFRSRPYGSRIGAWASFQSQPLRSRRDLEERAQELARRFGDDVPLPDHWGGFRLHPIAFEFWKGRRDRMHDRFLYERAGAGWEIKRLAP